MSIEQPQEAGLEKKPDIYPYSQLVVEDNLACRIRLDEAEERSPMVAMPHIKDWMVKDMVAALGKEKDKQNEALLRLLLRWENNQLSSEEQDHESLLAVMFSVLRNSLPPQRQFKREQQDQQITALCDMLQGAGCNVDKGVGKSKAILPIYALVRALVDNDQLGVAVCLGASDASQAESLFADVNRVTVSFLETVRDLPDSYLAPKHKERLLLRLQTRLQSGLDYLDRNEPEKVNLLRKAEMANHRIMITTHSDYIFATTHDRERWFGFPPTVFDEWPLAQESTYVTTNSELDKEVTFEPDDVDHRNTVCKYLLMRLLSSQLDPADFAFQNGKAMLTAVGEERAVKLTNRLIGILAGGSGEVIEPTDKLLRDQINKIINEEILSQANLGSDSAQQIWQWLREYQDQLAAVAQLESGGVIVEEGEAISNQAYWTEHIAEELADYSSRYKEGRDYLREEGATVVRHGVLGIAERQKRFSFANYFAIANRHGQLVLPHEEKRTDSLQYATWVKYVMGGRVLGVSGSLYQMDRGKGQYQPTKFAREMEWATGRAVKNVSAEVPMIPLPAPQTFASEAQLEQFLLKSESSLSKPSLLVCWNEQQARRIQEEFVAQGLTAGVIYADTTLAEEEELIRNFTEGKVKALISTGRGSYGLDINAPTGEAFDFAVTVINPETAFQLEQALTRRRLDRDPANFHLLFDRPTLMKLGSYLKENPPKEFLFEGRQEMSAAEFLACVNYLDGTDHQAVADFGLTTQTQVIERFQNTLNSLLSEHERRRMQTDTESYEHEGKYIRHLEPYLRHLKSRLVEQKLRELPLYQTLIDRELEQLIIAVTNTEVGNDTENVVSPALSSALTKRVERIILNRLSQIEDTIWDDYYEVSRTLTMDQPQLHGNTDALLHTLSTKVLDKSLPGGEYYQTWHDFLESSEFSEQVRQIVETSFAQVRSQAVLVKALIEKEQKSFNEVEYIDQVVLPEAVGVIPRGIQSFCRPVLNEQGLPVQPPRFILEVISKEDNLHFMKQINLAQAIQLAQSYQEQRIVINKQPIIYRDDQWYQVIGSMASPMGISLFEVDLEGRIAYLNQNTRKPTKQLFVSEGSQMVRAWLA